MDRSILFGDQRLRTDALGSASPTTSYARGRADESPRLRRSPRGRGTEVGRAVDKRPVTAEGERSPPAAVRSSAHSEGDDDSDLERSPHLNPFPSFRAARRLASACLVLVLLAGFIAGCRTTRPLAETELDEVTRGELTVRYVVGPGDRERLARQVAEALSTVREVARLQYRVPTRPFALTLRGVGQPVSVAGPSLAIDFGAIDAALASGGSLRTSDVPAVASLRRAIFQVGAPAYGRAMFAPYVGSDGMHRWLQLTVSELIAIRSAERYAAGDLFDLYDEHLDRLHSLPSGWSVDLICQSSRREAWSLPLLDDQGEVIETIEWSSLSDQGDLRRSIFRAQEAIEDGNMANSEAKALGNAIHVWQEWLELLASVDPEDHLEIAHRDERLALRSLLLSFGLESEAAGARFSSAVRRLVGEAKARKIGSVTLTTTTSRALLIAMSREASSSDKVDIEPLAHDYATDRARIWLGHVQRGCPSE